MSPTPRPRGPAPALLDPAILARARERLLPAGSDA
jgi:hypothetical protein